MIAYILPSKRQRNGKSASNRVSQARLKLNGKSAPATFLGV